MGCGAAPDAKGPEVSSAYFVPLPAESLLGGFLPGRKKSVVFYFQSKGLVVCVTLKL